MDTVSMNSLLRSEEEKLRTELRADATVDRNRKQSVARLNAALDHMLLRYNAANADDSCRQGIADAQAAVMRDMLSLLLAGTAEKEIAKRRFRTGAVICLLLAVICGLISALLVQQYFAVGCVMTAAAATFAFLSGRLWYGEREVHVYASLDPDLVWKTVRKAADTMDRKTEEFMLQENARLQAAAATPSGAEQSLDEADFSLLGDLLEALYSENGDFALRQLKKLQPWLRQRGIETVDFGPETREFFEVLPTRRSSATQRPALLRGASLMLPGRATVHTD